MLCSEEMLWIANLIGVKLRLSPCDILMPAWKVVLV